MEVYFHSFGCYVSTICQIFSLRYRFTAVAEWSLIFIVLVAVSRPCIRFSSFRYRSKAVTEWSFISIVLVPVS